MSVIPAVLPLTLTVDYIHGEWSHQKLETEQCLGIQ